MTLAGPLSLEILAVFVGVLAVVGSTFITLRASVMRRRRERKTEPGVAGAPLKKLSAVLKDRVLLRRAEKGLEKKERALEEQVSKQLQRRTEQELEQLLEAVLETKMSNTPDTASALAKELLQLRMLVELQTEVASLRGSSTEDVAKMNAKLIEKYRKVRLIGQSTRKRSSTLTP
jgi:hypothetical protein